jgi:DNA processing protein
MNYNAVLAYFSKLTYNRYKKLTSYFVNLEQVWNAPPEELVKAGLPHQVAQEFLAWRRDIDVAKIEAELEKEGIYTVSVDEVNYPPLLAQINDPPHTLFFKGKLPKENEILVAIVGTRRCSAYGKQVTEELTTELARRGVVVVSGLALGIDGYAHQAALNAKGKTVAVLGSGIDQKSIQPASHFNIAQRIIKEGGALISEYPPGFKPTAYSFPARNRIIAGLCKGVLIAEAPTKSGALITAKLALDYNREVLVVPHAITSNKGAGGNNLIKHGATTITSANDVFETLGLEVSEITSPGLKPTAESPQEEELLTHLSKEPVSVEVLIKQTNLSSATVNAALTLMELNGKVKNLGGMMYVVK